MGTEKGGASAHKVKMLADALRSVPGHWFAQLGASVVSVPDFLTFVHALLMGYIGPVISMLGVLDVLMSMMERVTATYRRVKGGGHGA